MAGEQQRVLDAHQRIVARPVVDMVDRQPERGEEEQRDLRVAAPGSRKRLTLSVPTAHMAPTNIPDILSALKTNSSSGENLQPPDEDDQRREQVGAPLQLQLPLAAAGDVPVADHLHGEGRGDNQHEQAEA